MLLVVAEDERQAHRTMTTDDLKKEQRRMSRRASRTQALSKKLSSSKIKATSSSPPATPIQPESVELIPAPTLLQPQQSEQPPSDPAPTLLSPEAAQATAAGVDAKVERAAGAGPSSAVVETSHGSSESDGVDTRKPTSDKETLLAMSATIRKKMAHLEFMAAIYVQKMARAWITRQREKEGDDWGDDVRSPAPPPPPQDHRFVLPCSWTHRLLSRCVLAGRAARRQRTHTISGNEAGLAVESLRLAWHISCACTPGQRETAQPTTL